MKYRFEMIEHGQISEGYTILQIEHHEVEIDNGDVEKILLAEKNGGQLVEEAPPEPKIKAVKIPKGDLTDVS